MNRVLVAHTPLGETWWATRLQGDEALSSLYEFRLELKSEEPDIDIQAVMGETCAIECKADLFSSIRYFSGLVIGAAARGQSGKHWLYELRIAPKLWFASRRADFRIFQNLTVQAIADELLQQNAISYEWRLKNNYKTWEYLVQYGETDFAFLSRLFEGEGIYYWFEHGSDGEKMVLGDHFSAHEAFAGYDRIPFYPPDAAMADVDHYQEWCADREPESGCFKHTDYDFRHPSKDLTTEHNDPRGHLFDQYEIYAYPGNYVEPDDGKNYATARLEALQRNQDTAVFEGNVRGAVPGCRFTLYNHPRADQNRDFLITSAQYEITNSDYEGGPDTEQGRYRVQIGAIPADRQYRPRLRTPRPRTHGAETAVVVGPEGSEIHTDEYGRVKVHFHWDRYGQRDGTDSCWIRVSYPWAGSNFGGIHIPRVGQEVIVDHEHGDPQRPIITGRVYNAQQTAPWELPANKTQSGILTRTSLEGSSDTANALRFEDAKGEEEVWLHAEKDQRIEVENDETHLVGNDRTKTIGNNETTNVASDRTESVGNNETLNIGVDRTETVGGNETLSVGAAHAISVEAGQTVTVTAGGQKFTVLEGGQTFGITGDQTFTVIGGNIIYKAATGSVSLSAETTFDATSANAMTLKSDETISYGVGGEDGAGAGITEESISHGVGGKDGAGMGITSDAVSYGVGGDGGAGMGITTDAVSYGVGGDKGAGTGITLDAISHGVGGEGDAGVGITTDAVSCGVGEKTGVSIEADAITLCTEHSIVRIDSSGVKINGKEICLRR